MNEATANKKITIPRRLSKEVFRYIFSRDGDTPASYETLYSNYVSPHLKELEITEAVWKKYKSVPYRINRKLIKIHDITMQELTEALESCAQARAKRRKLARQKASR
ncbi:MAG: hypothetical protein MI974_31975 [Chitinophagales bacterium]|nr:hypothetical protein [Chitinophagales bacterium]